MDFFDKKTQSFTVSFKSFSRSFPHITPLSILGYLPHKSSMVNYTFDTFNFSLITRGKGFYQHGKSCKYEISAPCVITQWPNEKMKYGPIDDSWEEIYLIYDATCMDYFTNCGFISQQRRWWKIMQNASFIQSCEQLLSHAQKQTSPEIADQIDRLAEQVILTSLLPCKQIIDSKGKTILAIKELIDSKPCYKYNFTALAAKYNLSESVFRRSWRKYVGVPPQHYLIEQRMKIARKMLLETTLNISEIAWQLGYEDALYFSRLFHKFTGTSATTYRYNIRGD